MCHRTETFEENLCFATNFANNCDICKEESCPVVEIVGPVMCQRWICKPHESHLQAYKTATLALGGKFNLLSVVQYHHLTSILTNISVNYLNEETIYHL